MRGLKIPAELGALRREEEIGQGDSMELCKTPSQRKHGLTIWELARVACGSRHAIAL